MSNLIVSRFPVQCSENVDSSISHESAPEKRLAAERGDVPGKSASWTQDLLWKPYQSISLLSSVARGQLYNHAKWKDWWVPWFTTGKRDPGTVLEMVYNNRDLLCLLHLSIIQSHNLWSRQPRQPPLMLANLCQVYESHQNMPLDLIRYGLMKEQFHHDDSWIWRPSARGSRQRWQQRNTMEERRFCAKGFAYPWIPENILPIFCHFFG